MSIPLEPSEIHFLLEHMPEEAAASVREKSRQRAPCNLLPTTENTEEGDKLEKEYLAMCSAEGKKLNEAYWASNTALPESDDDFDLEDAPEHVPSTRDMNTEVNSSFTPTERAQVRQME
jgi:hypothetical protein